MTAVIHHGAPGSYKTFALVQRVLIPALIKGRVVITNVRGFNDLQKIKKNLAIDIPPTAQIYYLEPDTLGYENMAKFFHWAPAGALIVMDEGQRVYPTRDRRFDHLDQPDNIPIFDYEEKPLINTETGDYICRPATLEIAIDQHRHFNWDIYISTTNIAKIHPEIRKAVEWAFRHRDNSGLLPWYKNTWTEFRHDSEQSGKSLSHYSGAPKRYKADQRIFHCYQSTATGKTKKSSENISIFRDSKLRMLLAVIFIAVIYVGYNLSAALERIDNKIKKPDDPAIEAGVEVIVQDNPLPRDPDNHRGAPQNDAKALSHVNHLPASSALFKGAIFYKVSEVNGLDNFEVHFSDKRIAFMNMNELRSFGFKLVRRFGSGAYVAMQLGDETILALSKPPAPIKPQVASIERTAAPIGAFSQ